MKKYFNTVEDATTGRPVANAEVSVFDGGGNLASLYSDDGVTLTNNPVRTNSTGYFEFYVADGNYTIEVSYNGAVKASIADVEIIEAYVYPGVSDGEITTAKLQDGAVTAIKIASGQIVGGHLTDNTGELAAITDKLIFEQAGVGAIAQSLGGKVRHGVIACVFDYMTAEEIADVQAGTHLLDVSDAINTALAAHSQVWFPAGSYLAGDQLEMHAGQFILGAGAEATTIRKGFNGDLFDRFAAGAGLQNITLDGDGANFTGVLLPCKGSDGRQWTLHANLLDAEGPCLSFEKEAGSQSCFIGGRMARHNGSASDDYCSVVIAEDRQLLAKPRHFIAVQTDGTYFIAFGGSNNTHVVGGFSGGFKFHVESRAVYLSATRWANQSACTIYGHQINISGCDVLPALTLEGSGPIILGPGAYSGAITDNGTAGQNLVYSKSVSYTPTWTAASSNPDVGDGNIRGEYSRNGDVVSLSINLTIGASTTLGSGTWRFSLPVKANTESGSVVRGTVFMTDIATTTAIGVCRILDGGTYLEIQIPGGLNFVNASQPWAWASGDTLHISVDYIV